MGTKLNGTYTSSAMAAKARNELGHAPAATSADTIVLDREDEQLTPQELFERTDACGAVRDEIGRAHLELIAMARHVARPSRMLKRNVLDNHVRLAELALTRLQSALLRLPYALLLVACLALAGCDRECERCERSAAPAAPAGVACEQCRRAPVAAKYTLPDTSAAAHERKLLPAGNDH